MVSWVSASKSHTGKVRRVNEDALIGLDSQGFWAVADGMGGHAAGDYASQSITARFSQMSFADKTLSEVVQSLDDNLNDVNQQMINYAREHEASAVGSTVAAMHLGENQIGLSYWVGDSRVYQYRNNDLKLLSRDHSLVQELIDLGELTEESAINYPSKNVITRAIGANRQVYSEIKMFDYQLGDVYLICSDGLTNEVEDKELLMLIQSYSEDIEKLADVTMDAALENTASDNISFVYVKITGC